MDSPTNCLTHAVNKFRDALANSAAFQDLLDMGSGVADPVVEAALSIFGKQLTNPASGVAYTKDELEQFHAYGMVYPAAEAFYGKRRNRATCLKPYGQMIVVVSRLVPAADRNDIPTLTDDLDREWQNSYGTIADQVVSWLDENGGQYVEDFSIVDDTVTDADRVAGQGFFQGATIQFAWNEVR